MMYRWIFILTFSILKSITCISGQPDSLILLLENHNLSTEKQLQIYDEISWGKINSDIKKSLKYGFLGYKLADKSDNEHYKILFLRNIGVAYYMNDMYDSAHYYLDKAYDLGNNFKNQELISRVLLAKANLLLQTSKYDQAIEKYFESLRLTEDLKMEKESGKIYHNLGIAYQRLDNIEQALINFEKSKDLAEKTGDTHSLGFLNMAISNIYMETDHDKAMEMAGYALEAFQKHGNKYGETMALLTISQCLYFNENYSLAEDYADKAFKISNTSDFPKLKVEVLNVLSNINFYKKNYKVSQELAELALSIDTTTSHLVSNMLLNVIRSSIHLGNPEKASEYLNRYHQHLNRFASENYISSLSELEVKYETEKKEIKIASLEKERYLMGVLIAVTIIATGILIIYYINRSRLMKARERVNNERLERLEQEKKLIATRAALEAETIERSRLARDLHDGPGSMLSVVRFSLPEINTGLVINKESSVQFGKAIKLLDESIVELRRIAHHMMPESLLRLGLKNAVADFCQTNEKINFNYFGEDVRIESKLEILIYRAIHELVNNALKHSESSEINVQIIQEPERISVTVEDNGKGFDVNFEKNSSMGLKNLKHRVESYEGSIAISSGNKGTEVQLDFDLKS